ncbi:MAG: head-tail connector protein [Rhodobacterales bacterium]|nr:head-tail connector protein [Rhodobacterales bacterium]MDX5412085.1 head-tail connector protein [Rhodobacterales bacterium]
MMMLVQRTPQYSVNATPVGLLSVKQHLRVYHDDEDLLITDMILAAMADIEEAAQIAVLAQTIRVTSFRPGYETTLHLPIGPALQPEAVTVTLDGEPFTGFEMVTGNRPMIRFHASYPDPAPSRLQVEYVAGFGTDAQSVPRDLQLAITDQAALMYEARGEMDPKARSISATMARIAARYRGIRL